MPPSPDEIDLERVVAELTTPLVSDTLDALGYRSQCLATGIHPLENETVMAGYAFPVTIRRVYDLPSDAFAGLLAALDAIRPGEVFVTPTARATDIAVWGELLTTVTRERGGVGALTDGLVRDTRALRQLAFPVFSAGTTPLDSKGRHEIVAHRVPCVIDGVRIEPGDLVIGDSDGIVVVPRALATKVVEGALEKRKGEREFLNAILSGRQATDAYAEFGVL